MFDIAAAGDGPEWRIDRKLFRSWAATQAEKERRKTAEAEARLQQASREVHELLSRTERLGERGHLSKLTGEAEELLSDWNELSSKLGQLESGGLTGSKWMKVRQLQQDLVYPLGQVAAALVGR